MDPARFCVRCEMGPAGTIDQSRRYVYTAREALPAPAPARIKRDQGAAGVAVVRASLFFEVGDQ
jgi:hypothetical protein